MKRIKASKLWSVDTSTAWQPNRLLLIAPYVQTPAQMRYLPHCQRFIAKTTPLWQVDKLKSIRLVSGHSPLNLPFYQRRLATYWQGYSTLEKLWATPAWGALQSPQHMLHHKALEWGFQLTEIQIAQGIYYFLTKSSLICFAFVQALLYRKPNLLAQLAKDKAAFLATVRIKTTEQGEVLHIQWQGSKHDYALLISFWLKSPSVLTTLPEYWQNSLKRERSPTLLSYHFTVHNNVDAKKGLLFASTQTEKWQCFTWVTLLQAWERYLSLLRLSGEQDFARFRRTLWQGITGY